MDILLLALAALVGALFGMASYRYLLKRDPVKLEKWAKEAKIRGDAIKDRF